MKTAAELLSLLGKKYQFDFEEFLRLLKSYGELEFSYNSTKYGVLRLNDDYTSGKDKIWNRSKDYYAMFEIFNPDRGWTYRNLDEFSQAKINGELLKNIWDKIENLNELCCSTYHGVPGTHEHRWTENGDRGPAFPIDTI